MQLDGFTTVAQIVNFLILVVLLKRFLYGPIIRAMDAREAHIAAQVEAAQDRLAEAERQAAHYHEQQQDFNRTREAMLSQAEEEAESRRQGLIDLAREEVQEMQARWQQTLRQEQLSFLQDIRQQAGLQVLNVARHAFEDLANQELELTVVQVFLERLIAFGDEGFAFSQSASDPTLEVVIQSAFVLPAEAQGALTRAVHEHLAKSAQVQFATRPGLICGLELAVQGQKIAWHLAHYMDHLEEQFTTMLGQGTDPKTAITL